jgi:hypothetical protein
MDIPVPQQELAPIDALTVDGQNPNMLTPQEMDRLMQSIRKWGFIVPIVTNRDLLIADGEHKWEAAKRLGMTHVPVIRLDVDEVDRRLLRQVLNKLRGRHDPLGDAYEFKRIVEAKGESDLKIFLDLSTKELNHYLDLIHAGVGLPSKPVEKTDIQRGDLYSLGPHRLMCGDATSQDDIAKLIASRKVDMIFLDPTFGMELQPSLLEYYTSQANLVIYANSEKEILKAITNPHFKYLLIGTYTYSSVPSENRPLIHHTLIAVFYKDNPYQAIWPPLSTVIPYFKKSSGGYQKNPYFLERLLHAYTQKEQTILDLFAGWGNMLNICLENERRYLGMDLNPLQIQQIIDNLQAKSGESFKKAV